VTTPPGTGGDVTGGFAKAVEMCNNNGHCRKFDAGTMCPSYRVTRDEKHLTRGRANTLRLALSGQLGSEGFGSESVREALDLCVGCKGCKRDCPTGVDMAKMKLEFIAHDKAARGFTLKDKLIGRLPDYVGFASRWPWVFNAANSLPLLARLRERFTGLSAKRQLPRFRRDTFWQAMPQLGLATREQTLVSEKPVVLFVDTFNGHFESENALAAVKVLQAAGYTVHVAAKGDGHLCCGRTHLSAGLVDEAKAKARELLEALLPFAQRGVAIVGLEPSCLLTLRDEMRVFGLGDGAQTLADHALLLEEFLAREARSGRFAPPLRATTKAIKVHGHCHQKAFGAFAPVMDVLKLIPGAKPEAIESSCCGMAGSFGYEAAHHEVSMQMAELSLLPAVRSAPDAIVVADGTSCRHQIADGAGREALHVARVLADHLA
jgi:Fe-S oxidoreductase